MGFDDPSGIDRLDAYLDAIARGQRPAPGDLDPTLIDTDRRFRRLDDAPAPNRAFVKHLREDLVDASLHPGPSTLDLNLTTTADGHTAPPAWQAPRRLPVRAAPRRGRWALAQLATAALLVLTFGSFFLAFGRHAVFTPAGQGTAIPAASPTTDVPMFRGNLARTGELAGPGPVGTPGIAWSVRLAEGTDVSANGPAVVDGVAYVGASRGGGLQAIDTTSGAVRWRAETDGFLIGFPAVAKGVVYVGSGTDLDGQGTVQAFDAATGNQRWRFDAQRRLGDASPAVVDGVVYVASGAISAPAVVDDTVYVGGGHTTGGSSEASVLFALDAATGTERWRLTLEGTGYFAVDAATGTQRWFVETGQLDVGFTPAVADGIVYAGNRDGYLYAIDAASGAERWRFTAADSVYGIAVAGGLVYAGVGGFASQTYLYAVDAATGQERWRFITGGRVRSSPAVVDDTVYVGSDDGNLYAVDAATGTERWQVEVGGRVRGFPVVVDGVIYLTHGFSDTGGELFAIGDLPAGATPGAGTPAGNAGTPTS